MSEIHDLAHLEPTVDINNMSVWTTEADAIILGRTLHDDGFELLRIILEQQYTLFTTELVNLDPTAHTSENFKLLYEVTKQKRQYLSDFMAYLETIRDHYSKTVLGRGKVADEETEMMTTEKTL